MKLAFTDAAFLLWVYGTFISEHIFAEVVNMQFANFSVNMLRELLLFLCVCFLFSKASTQKIPPGSSERCCLYIKGQRSLFVAVFSKSFFNVY